MTQRALRTTTDRAGSWKAAWRSIVESPSHRAVHDLHLAAERGDGARVASLLAPNVAVVVDAGDDEHPHAHIVRGVDDAATVLMRGLAARPGLVVLERPVNDQPGLILQRNGEPIAVMTVDFIARCAVVLWIRLHPAKLRHWNHV